MELQKLIESAETVKAEYAAQHERTGRVPWTAAEYAQGFVGDVGDLLKLVMANNGYRDIEDMENRLAHELCDCLWSVLILAEEYKIDLESGFPAHMESIIGRIRSNVP